MGCIMWSWCLMNVGTMASTSRPAKKSKKSDKSELDQYNLASTFQKTFNVCLELKHRTQWYCKEDGQRLHIHDDLMEAFTYIGGENLLQWKNHHYPILTCEFLATFTTSIKSPQTGGKIQFQLGNKWFKLTLKDLNDTFWFPNPIYDDKVQHKTLETWSYLFGVQESAFHN